MNSSNVKIVSNFRVWHQQPIAHLWSQGKSYKEAGYKGAGILAHNERCFQKHKLHCYDRGEEQGLPPA